MERVRFSEIVTIQKVEKPTPPSGELFVIIGELRHSMHVRRDSAPQVEELKRLP